MKYKKEYMNMVDLGRLFGMSSHQIGKSLKKLGLRQENGKPSSAAYNQDLVSFVNNEWGICNTVWNAEKVVRILEDTGHKPVFDPPTDLVNPPTLTGPFSLSHSDDDRWQITGNDDAATILVSGERNARVVLRVMNIAHKGEILKKILETTT